MELWNQARKYGSRVLAVGAGATLPLFAFAGSGGTYDGITSAVDFAEVATAVVAIGGLIAVALVARKGVRMVLSMIGR